MADRCISILGCGWLGYPLARALVRQGYQVKGSTTHLEKIPVLNKAGIFSFCFSVDDTIPREAAKFFESETLIVTLPFRRSFADPRQYQTQIETIMKAAEQAKVAWVIFTSSTAVYPESLSEAREDAVFVCDQARAQVLWDIEQRLLKSKNFKATVIRLAGLYGPDRNIGKFLSGQKDLSDGQKPVNLIHLDDAVGILLRVIEQKAQGEIFNACSPQHPLRQDVYTAAAKKNGLPPPTFTPGVGPYKKVSHEKVIQQLNYRFVHPDPMKEIG